MKSSDHPLHRLATGVAAVCLALPFLARAEYPQRPIRVIVPAIAGGSADALTRVVCHGLAKRLRQPCIVENKPGASGAIGLDAIAKAAPDGYTIGTTNLAVLVAGLTARKLPFSADALQPIAKLSTQPNLLVVNPEVPVKSVSELVAYAKAHPNRLNYGSSGNGTSLHVVTELFRQSTGIEITHVPYRSAPLGEADLVSGQIQMMISNFISLSPQIKAGRVRPLAITSPKRSPLMPDVPTMAEAGVPNAEMVTWGGVIGPKGMPPHIVQQLNTAINSVLSEPAVIKKCEEMGCQVDPQSVAQFGDLIRSDTAHWSTVVKKAKITVD
jgi:tripartite-type tricarboxylate transporter receptor subunit TctC